MTYAFSEADISQFQEQGYICPVPVLQADDVAALRGQLEAVEASQGGSLEPPQRNKAHLLFKWIDDLIRDPRILDPVSQLIGEDLLCWNTLFWIKEAGSESFISWHQDTRYWGLSSEQVVTAWLALSPASIESGCMRVMPGSHIGDVLPHEDRYDENNMLTRGQEITDGVDDDKAVYMPLEPGQMSVHNYRLAHASGPNNAPDRRIGLSMHFMPPDTAQIVGEWDSAALVRGEDKFHHFEPTPVPTGDFDPPAVAFHARATRAIRDVLYADAAQNTEKL
ncbi:MAG: phytanoyl-CoA dioxygenase family protein [Rhodospirillaceae bacterium]|jgi:non-haem Fe2+, alpha-ketoglutarate-dependent halogenase|nr:phytanoyl-CoA dioxygenase family protein [Rhodospirillaceae bacterium]